VNEGSINVLVYVDKLDIGFVPQPSINQLPYDVCQTKKDKFLALLSLYSDVIATDPEDLECTQMLSHHINTGDPPSSQKSTLTMSRKDARAT